MKGYREKRWLGLLLLLCMLAGLAGCEKKEKELVKIRDLEFTVLEDANVPEEMRKQINERKATPFTLTYVSDGYLYLAEGYGTQKSGGYSIRVSELFETEEEVVFRSELLGPGQNEAVLQMETHPYIVVKTQDIGKEAIFP